MYFSIDFGGTNTRVASSRDLSGILDVKKFPTSADLGDQVLKITATISDLSSGEEVEFVVAGLPGIIDKKNRILENIVNYPQLTGKPFEALLGETTKLPNLIVENDAALAGLAEAALGVGKDHNVVAYLTLSTGVGGVRIENGVISPSQEMSEPGHMIINSDSREKFPGTNIRGSLGAVASGLNFERIYGLRPENCDDEKIWQEYANLLSAGIHNVIVMWDPDVIVLGGAVSQKFELFIEFLNQKLQDQDLYDVPRVLKSDLGDDNVLLGGMLLLQKYVNSVV